jgi:hypothetical protein
MVRTGEVRRAEMVQLTNSRNSRCHRWCVAVVLFAAISLAVSVATRYGFSPATANRTATTTIQNHLSPDAGRQRLLKNAATWMPPVVSAMIFQAPAAYPRIAPAAPLIPSLFFEKNLYNRPPPFLNPSHTC